MWHQCEDQGFTAEDRGQVPPATLESTLSVSLGAATGPLMNAELDDCKS